MHSQNEMHDEKLKESKPYAEKVVGIFIILASFSIGVITAVAETDNILSKTH
jgi:hypothetical protein